MIENTKVFSIKRTVGLTAFIYVGGSAYFLSNTNEEFSLKVCFLKGTMIIKYN